MATTYLTLTNSVLRELNETELTSATFSSSRGIQTAVKDFINKGSKVKVVVKTKGREIALFDYKSFFDRVLEALDDVKFDSTISRTHGRYSCIITAQ